MDNKRFVMENRTIVDLPENEIGEFRIQKSKRDYGIETELIYQDKTIMSDRPSEFKEHIPFFSLQLHGNVLVCGLGIGFINEVLITIPEIEKVVIVEKHQEVIDLVWPYCKKDERFEIIHDDADTWKPTMNFDFAWLDSWIEHDKIEQDEWWEITTKKYSPYCETVMVWKPTHRMT